MKVNRMFLDGQLDAKPEGSTLQNRNVLINKIPGTWTGEPGTLLLGDLQSRSVGEIQLPNNTQLLFVNPDKLYVVNGNGFTLLKQSSVFAFNKPIHGRASYNHRGETVVVWTDGTSPRYLNLSKIPTTITDDNINLNIFKDIAQTTVIVESGKGGLLSGVYYPMMRGITDEGSTTGWVVQKPYKVFTNSVLGIDETEGQLSGQVTNQAITLTITSGLYEQYEYGYIYKKDGELFAYSVGKANKRFTFTGSEVKTTIALDEVLVERAYYKNVGLIETIGNVLYLGDLETYSEPDIQLLVNNIGVTWTSSLVSPNTLKLNTQDAGFAPGEVYALYFRYVYKWGKGSWFHIPGRSKQPSDTNFLYEDTADILGKTNYWENADETYPDEARFGTLRNTKVRHHGTPSINWLRNNVYSSNDVGTTRLPRIEFRLSNIPINADSIGWELGYAERNPNNSLTLGQSAVIESEYDAGDTANTNKYSSVGMNGLTIEPSPSVDGFINMVAEPHLMRLHPFEGLLGANIQPTAYRREYKLRSREFTINRKYRRQPGLSSAEELAKPNTRYTGTIDYTAGGTVTSTTADTKIDIPITYVPKDTYFKGVDNFSLEKMYLMDLFGINNAFPLSLPNISNTLSNITEETYIITLLSGNKNCYKSVDNQSIVVAGSNNQYTGDCYITNYTYHTYGKKRANEETYGLYDAGFIFARRILVYSVYPIDLRNTNLASNQYTSYYPKGILETYSDSWRTTVEPNGFTEGFNKDYASINNIDIGSYYNSKQQHIFQNWIARSQIYQSTDNWFGWRDFRLNDVLIMPATYGRMKRLTRVGQLMYIHFEKMLYITRGGEELQLVGRKTQYVGTGDIFSAPPEEVIYGEDGALGLAHRICATMTDYGYCFLDTVSDIGAVYLVNGKDVKVLSENGMVEFFRNNMNIVNNPLTGPTIRIGYDPVYKRLLIMHKGMLPKNMDKYRGEYRTGMILQDGDIVYKDGIFVKVQNLTTS